MKKCVDLRDKRAENNCAEWLQGIIMESNCKSNCGE